MQYWGMTLIWLEKRKFGKSSPAKVWSNLNLVPRSLVDEANGEIWSRLTDSSH